VNTVSRRFFALLSACGITVGALAYIESFFCFANIASINRLLMACGIGLVLLIIPIVTIEPSLLTKKNFWSKFTRGMPSWVSPCIIFFSLVAVVHFAWFRVQNGGGIPIIRDGQYLLSDRGRPLKVLTETEYMTMKDDEVRQQAAPVIVGYLIPMFYWWFPRSSREAD